MPRPGKDVTDSGVVVYPQLPVPKAREGGGEGRPPQKQPRGRRKLIIGVVVVALLGGVAGGMALRPIVAPDPRIAESRRLAEEAGSAAAAAKARAAGLEQELDDAGAKRREVEQRLAVASKAETQLAESAADEARRTKDLAAAQKQIGGALKGVATVAVEGADLRITIGAGALFAKDDVLSDRGKQILDRVGAALKEVLDKQIAVSGHTDDTPLPLAPPPKAAPAPRKGARPAAPPPAAPPPRLSTNWELSAARAVAVVRHLQESAKLEPTRLSATGFGQYRPISRRDKALNRRIEILLSPRPKAAPAP